MTTIDTHEALRELYAAPSERSLRKQLDRLDEHCRGFIERAPFVVVSSCSAALALDASPRGGPPGFVELLDERTLLIPDEPGNNRLDTLENIVETGRVGLLFLVPGVDETLRVNGGARLSCSEAHLDRCAGPRRRPRLVIEVWVVDAYLQCAKALMRSALWDPARHIDRSLLPTMNRMLADHTGSDAPIETQEAMLARYAREL